jgi:histidinol-phosphate aminotransferase
MRDQDYKNACSEKIKRSRSALQDALKILGFRVWNSQANFLLVQPPQGNAESIYLALKANGILVRYFNHSGLDDKLRITVGTDEQNQRLIQELQNF